ncbi:flavin-containing monooxygenase [Saccharothrix deserti]|uniref:flavin-containing monooxygenase n=1 Tax=Saccharothrix deserti TaxID=2593674 RepID=UPI00131AEB86|nr:NAD(P)/FAD-dependent oxidoreductase [Saccharothrix deserti]
MADKPEIVIVGAGLAGICAAINLLKKGVRDFVILEKASGAGGTWRYNTYPGSACDVVSNMYSYSFAPKADWESTYAGQPEIQRYVEEVFDTYGLGRVTRFDTEVLSYTYDDATDRWQVQVAGGEVLTPRVVIAGIGALHNPNIPKFKGAETFAGEIVHSARWNPDLDLTGKRVAVVGVGSSAVQIVPAIAGQAAHVHVVQRTPQWVLPKPNRPFSRFERFLFRVLPVSQKVYRNVAYWSHELAIIAFMHPPLLKVFKAVSLRTLRKQIPDPELRAKLTPDYTIGCKRILLTSDYYPALMRDDVTLVDSGIAEFEVTGFRTENGEFHEADVVILATGFATDNRLAEERITGRGGLTIQEAWRDGMRAHLGTTIAGFPNFFLMMGPNSGGGSQSILFVIEAQAHYIAQCVRMMRAAGARSLEIRADVEREFNKRIHAKLARSVWNSGGCDSWFLDRSGQNRQAWPGSSVSYWRLTRQPSKEWFELRGRSLEAAR